MQCLVLKMPERGFFITFFFPEVYRGDIDLSSTNSWDFSYNLEYMPSTAELLFLHLQGKILISY